MLHHCGNHIENKQQTTLFTNNPIAAKHTCFTTMAPEKGSKFDEYWNSIDNVVIYLSNISPYYIFSVVVSFFAVFVVCWYRTITTCLNTESQATNDPDEETEHVKEVELKTKTAEVKEKMVGLMNEFPDSLITEEFLHDDLIESSESNCERVSPEDAPGGDGNFKQQKGQKEKKGIHKSDEEVDPYSSQPNPMSRFKKARQAAIIERVTGNMSEEQLKEEKEAEASQIAAIWDLLNQQKDQFNIGTEQELQEQLHLYCL